MQFQLYDRRTNKLCCVAMDSADQILWRINHSNQTSLQNFYMVLLFFNWLIFRI